MENARAGVYGTPALFVMQLYDITAHREAFTDYYRFFAGRFSPESKDAEHLHLKWEHSLNVLANAEKILSGKLPAAFTPELVRAAQLAALYHDVARFEQYIAYHTFRDAESADHGAWGSKLLKTLPFLDGESSRVKGLVRAGVNMHNRFAIPAGVPEAFRLVTEVVRDADKIDILRVVSAYAKPGGRRSNVVTWKLKDEPERWTGALYDAVLGGRLGISSDMRYINDFLLLLCSWLYDLNFKASYDLVREQGHMETVLSGLPEGAAMDRIRAAARRALDFGGDV